MAPWFAAMIKQEDEKAERGAGVGGPPSPTHSAGFGGFGRAALVALASAGLLVAVVATRPQGLGYFDSPTQLLALKQFLAGETLTPNELWRPDPDDLARATKEWLAWWPPSTQLLTWPLVAMGESPGDALRVVVAAALLLGAVGWALWMRRFGLPTSWLLVLAAALPWMRYASSTAFRYSAEVLAFAAVPWLLLTALRAGGATGGRRWAAAATLGFAAGISYLLKYSIVLPALGMLAWLAADPILEFVLNKQTRGADDDAKRTFPGGAAIARAGTVFAVALAGFVVVPILFKLISRHMGGADPSADAPGFALDWRDYLFVVANPALALADAFGPIFFLLVSPGYLSAKLGPLLGVTSGGTIEGVGVCGLPGGMLFYALVARRLRRRAVAPLAAAERLALTAFAANLFALFVLWQFTEVDHVPRHLAPAALAMLPLIVAEGRAAWGAWRDAPRRALLLAGAAVYLALPLAFGPLYVATKVRGIPADYRTGPSGFYVPELAPRDLEGVRRRLAEYAGPDSVWVVERPCVALDLPGRTMLIFGGRSVGEEIRARSDGYRVAGYRTSRAVELLVLLPPDYEAGAEPTMGERVRGSFAGAEPWERIEVEGTPYVLWRARMSATPR